MPQKGETETRFTYSAVDIKGVIWQMLNNNTYSSTCPKNYVKWNAVSMIDDLRWKCSPLAIELESELRMKRDWAQRYERVQKVFGNYLQTVPAPILDMERKIEPMRGFEITPMNLAILYVASNLDKSPNGQDTKFEDIVTIAAERLGLTNSCERYFVRDIVRNLRFNSSHYLSTLGARLAMGSYGFEIRYEVDMLMKEIESAP